jgi:hypothetical protein
LALTFGPALATALLVARHAVNVPVWDDWERAPLAAKWAEGRLALRDLYAPHLEHRIVLPRLAMLANLELTGGDLRAEMALSFLFLLAGGVALAGLARRSLGAGAGALAVTALANLVFFTPLQWENLLWAIQLAFVISLACIPITLWVLAAPLPPRARFAACLGLALLATHSFGHGLLLWPLVAVYVLLEPGGRHKPAFLAAWALAAALVLVPYFTVGGFRNESVHAYERPPGEAPPALVSVEESLAQEDRLRHFALSMLGSPLARNPWLPPPDVAPWLGAALLALYAAAAVAALRLGRFGAALPWLGLGGGAIAACAITAVGRSSLIFEEYALIPHYVSVPVQLVAALIGLGALLLPRSVAITAGLCFLPTQILGWQAGAEGMWVWEQARLRARTALVYVEHLEPRLPRRIDWDRDAVRKWAGMLDRHGYLDPPLARKPNLLPFEVARGPAELGPVRVERARERDGKLWVRGRGLSHGVLLTWREGPGLPRTLALGEGFTPVRRPTFGWEHAFDYVATYGTRRVDRWDAEIPLAELPPRPRFDVEVWVVDSGKMQVERLRQVIEVRRRPGALHVTVAASR